MKWLARLALLLVILAGTSSANEYVWREAEDATATTFNHSGWYQNGDASFVIDKTLMSPGVPGSTAGDWRAHYAGGSTPAYIEWNNITLAEGGTYTWWVRLAPFTSAYQYSVDGGTAANVDLAQQHEVLNVVEPNINNVHYLGWVKVGEINLAPGTHTLRVTAVAYGGAVFGAVDCMCLVNSSWTPTGALQPPGSSTNPDPTPGPGVWFPLHVADDAFSAQSITDMRDTIAATTGIPAGSKGYVTRVQDHFELSDAPGVPVKFWGLTATHPAYSSTFDQQARFYVKQGINVVRRHPMISEVGEALTNWSAYDRWFKALKDNGIYSDWSVFYPDSVAVSRSFLPTTPSSGFQALLDGAGVTADQLWNELPAGSGSTKKLGGFDNFVQWYQDGEWNWESDLLQHVNPYTGIAYVDDPALAIVEVQNEDCVFWHWPLGDGFCNGTQYPYHHKLLVYMWFQWLQGRYADDAALQAAWGSGWMTGDSVVTFNPGMKIYAAWEMYGTGPFSGAQYKARCGDWIRFLAETQRAEYETRFANVRALGFQGVQLSTGWKAGGPATAAANNWADDAGDAIDHHTYMGGGAGGWYVGTGSVSNQSQLSDPGNYVLALNRQGTSSGGGAPYESVFQVEDKPAVVTEWDESMPTQWRAEISPLFAFYGMGLQGWDGSFNFAGSYPWMETGWPGHSRGPGTWVAETPVYIAQFPALARSVYGDYVQQGAPAAARRMSVDDLFRGVDPLSQDLPDGGYAGSSNMLTPSEVNAIGRVTIKASDSLSSSDSAKVDWTSYWDQTNQVITSTTGQLVWDYADKVVQVKAPETQGVVGWAGGKGVYDLGDIQVSVDANTPFCSLLFTPLDDQPLATSAHILVTALAQDKQMGTVYSSSGDTLTTLGGPPLLLQPVQAAVTVGGSALQSVNVVDIYGVPTGAEVPLAGNTFTINGNYTTVYYEISRAAAGSPTIALSAAALSPSCVQGSSPTDDSFQVWNTGTAPLSYAISDDADWLSVSPAGGSSTDSGDKQTHTVSYSAAGLTPGTYTGHISVADASATNSPQTVTVSLTVQAPSTIALSTAALSPSCVQGSNPADDGFQVWNSGGVPLNYTVSDDANWLSVTPTSGTSADASDKQSHTVSYTASNLTPGTYTGHISVADASATNSPQTITVSLTVQAPPTIALSTRP